MGPTCPAPPPPATGVVRTFGYLNVIFGGLLFFCGPCPGIFLIFGLPYLQTFQSSVGERIEKQKESELRALDEQEKRAETEDEKLRIRAERRRVASQPVPVMTTLDVNQFGLGDRRVRSHYLLEAATCLVVNLLLIFAGVGLLRRQAWGRPMSMAAGIIKIARLFALLLSYVLIVQPAMRPGLTEMLRPPPADANATTPEAREAELIGEVDAVQTLNRVLYIAIFLGGAIYPALLIAFLSRRSARAALVPPPGPPEPR